MQSAFYTVRQENPFSHFNQYWLERTRNFMTSPATRSQALTCSLRWPAINLVPRSCVRGRRRDLAFGFAQIKEMWERDLHLKRMTSRDYRPHRLLCWVGTSIANVNLHRRFKHAPNSFQQVALLASGRKQKTIPWSNKFLHQIVKCNCLSIDLD